MTNGRSRLAGVHKHPEQHKAKLDIRLTGQDHSRRNPVNLLQEQLPNAAGWIYSHLLRLVVQHLPHTLNSLSIACRMLNGGGHVLQKKGLFISSVPFGLEMFSDQASRRTGHKQDEEEEEPRNVLSSVFTPAERNFREMSRQLQQLRVVQAESSRRPGHKPFLVLMLSQDGNLFLLKQRRQAASAGRGDSLAAGGHTADITV
ncbi:hypothetical protein CRENBAI_000748 [Crenichthys baileyi]|uniref:Uncharacterized protein n=1 Tax=Crenichthys baileyi TaxID=28760 RepID=A0AAV9RSV6_9TELE